MNECIELEREDLHEMALAIDTIQFEIEVLRKAIGEVLPLVGVGERISARLIDAEQWDVCLEELGRIKGFCDALLVGREAHLRSAPVEIEAKVVSHDNA